MKIEDQVVSLELSKRLKELGVKQESHFSFWEFCHGNIELMACHKIPVLADYKRERKYKGNYWTRLCSAFTVAELGEMLPIGIASVKRGNGFYHSERGTLPSFEIFKSDIAAMEKDGRIGESEKVVFESVWILEETEANARAKQLISLIEQKLVKP